MMKKKLSGLFLIWFCLNTGVLYGHDIHISYGKAKLSEKNLSVKVTFYKDDFMQALQNWRGRSLQGLSNNDFDQLKLDYLRRHFEVFINDNQQLQLSIETHNEDEQSIWFELHFQASTQINALTLKYRVLTAEFSNQMNLLTIQKTQKKKNLIFKSGQTEQTIRF